MVSGKILLSKMGKKEVVVGSFCGLFNEVYARNKMQQVGPQNDSCIPTDGQI